MIKRTRFIVLIFAFDRYFLAFDRYFLAFDRYFLVFDVFKALYSKHFRGAKKRKKEKKKKRTDFHENCPMFSLCSNYFDFALLRQRQFLTNDGEKSEEIKSKKYFKQGYTATPISLRSIVLSCDLVGATPNPNSKNKSKGKNGTRFARDLLKAKARDS